MRILQFANFYTPTSGGLRTCVEEIGRRYVELGHERILAVPGRHDADEQTPAGRRVTFASPPLLGTGEYRVLTARQRLVALLDAVEPDVLEVSDKFSVRWLSQWARPRGVPIVLFSHERLDAILRVHLPARLPLVAAADVVNRRLAARVDVVVAASAFSAQEFVRIGVPHIRRVPLGVDLDTFHPVQSTVDDGVIRLVLVSRLSSEKNPRLAIETLRHLVAAGRPVELTVVGAGPGRHRVQRWADGLPVRFVGHVADRPAIAALIASADVALSPARTETFGLATLEALACGTPVVVPDEGALAELVDGPASGRVCAPTPAAFAQGVLDLTARPRSERQAAARSAAERFPWSRTVDALLDLYRTTALATAD